jgi:lipopolysaccharide/colanic/teichoic acid biosynthesis glycosyltransferase
MYKFRTMHVVQQSASPITATHDPRIFAFGRLLRALKIDELPQLWNILRGDMAIIGPRPEDPQFVERDYRGVAMETLRVRPGLSSPGTLYAYVQGDAILDSERPADAYRDRLLPIKLALDVAYVRHASAGYDLQLILRTLWMVGCRVLGRRTFPDPPEMAEAIGLSRLLAASVS